MDRRALDEDPPESEAAGLDRGRSRGPGESQATEDADTRTRLLDAAEHLFAERTYAQTSLRAITAAAGANLAAVNYHFGSKERLFRAVFHRRIEPINAERLERLGVLQEQHAHSDPPLAEALDALFRPVVRMRTSPGGQAFATLISRSLWADGAHWKSLSSEFDEVRDAFAPILCRACPHLDRSALMWRMHFALAGMCLVLCTAERIG
ncbi:MAG: TetR/AcrR family transcriptional regulator, partial [Planctomycetota bacterium]